MGRADHQTKIRGYRIELGEIEATLLLAPDIVQAVVVARKDPARGAYLAAYLVSESGRQTQGGLRSFLSEKLPAYMVPASLVFLGEIPLTPSGKIDRQALPEPDFRTGLEASEEAGPRSPIEEVLVEIFSEVLRMERVGIHDHFFELGGHSLMATQVLSRIARVFGVEITLRQLFEKTTVAGLAQCLSEAQQASAGLKKPPLLSFSRPPGDPPFLRTIAFVVLGSLTAWLAALQPSRGGEDYRLPESRHL